VAKRIHRSSRVCARSLLLAQLSYWCKQGWSRQTKIARMVAASLNESMTGWAAARKSRLIARFLSKSS
jgi:hypothetical protein